MKTSANFEWQVGETQEALPSQTPTALLHSFGVRDLYADYFCFAFLLRTILLLFIGILIATGASPSPIQMKQGHIVRTLEMLSLHRAQAEPAAELEREICRRSGTAACAHNPHSSATARFGEFICVKARFDEPGAEWWLPGPFHMRSNPTE